MKVMKIDSAACSPPLAARLGCRAGAFAQAKEQFFPVLSYRTGPYAPNGTPWANG